MTFYISSLNNKYVYIGVFKNNKVCHHENVRPDVDFAYCPDCGELVENQWFLIRCSCCGVKLKAIMKNGEIIPENRFVIIVVLENIWLKEFLR